MKRLILAAVLAVMLSGCENPNPLAPSQSPPPGTIIPVEPPAELKWPVTDPNRFGWESPDYPPSAEQCPKGFVPEYNGHNWVCDDPNSYDREFPSTWRYR